MKKHPFALQYAPLDHIYKQSEFALCLHGEEDGSECECQEIHTCHRTESMHVHCGLYLISTCFSLLIQYSSNHTLYYVCIIMLPIYVDDDRVVLQEVEKSPTKKLGKFQHLNSKPS